MNIIKKLSLFSACTLWSASAFAVPAMPGLMTMMQPDGSEVKVRLIGDEFSHHYLTEDGYLLSVKDNTFFYADVDDSGSVVSSGIVASPAAERSGEANAFLAKVDKGRIAKAMAARREASVLTRPMKAPSKAVSQTMSDIPGLFPGADFPCHGRQKGLVILVNYADLGMQTPSPADYFSRMLNQPGFSDNGATGSARDFFIECSGGRFDPEFDVYGPVTLPQKRAYYGRNNIYTGNDERAHEMIIDACKLLDDEIDFSRYDRNGDGYIDNVFVFYAGRGEANGGGDDTVWPHAWEIEAGNVGTYVFDGVVLNRYACSNEWVSGRTDGVGTFIHEFSHVMGLPDLYSTNGSGSFTPSEWSALDYGPYNNSGRTPPLYGAFERCALGWMTPNEIEGPLSAVLEPISSNTAGIIRTSSPNEYFLIENRQQTGWDKYIPGHGMLVWHVNYIPKVWTDNIVNNLPDRQYVDIEEADGVRSDGTRAGDAFPGTSGITSFTGDTDPGMVTWSGEKLPFPITDITESPEGLISFNVSGGAEHIFGTTEVYEATDVTHCSFRASWKAVEGMRYSVSLFDASTMEPVAGYENIRTGMVPAYEFTGLQSSTEYAFSVRVGNDWQFGEPSEAVRVTTERMTFDLRTVEALDASDITPNSFTASWLPLPEASEYKLSVFTLTSPETEAVDCDFAGKKVPEGWTTSYTASFGTSNAFSGDEVPSLKFSGSGNQLESPLFEKPVSALRFWSRCTNDESGNVISLSGLIDGKWEVLENLPMVKALGGKRYVVNNLPAGVKALRWEFVRTSEIGLLYIDDIHIECCEPAQRSYLDGYDRRSMGTETSCVVDGLSPETTYYYIVEATDGRLSAIPSREVSVVLPKESGIFDIVGYDDVVIGSTSDTVIIDGCPADTNVTVTDISGRPVASAVSDGGTVTLPVGVAGVYIVRAGSSVAKVLVR